MIKSWVSGTWPGKNVLGGRTFSGKATNHMLPREIFEFLEL